MSSQLATASREGIELHESDLARRSGVSTSMARLFLSVHREMRGRT
jgi:hypothetical protein